MFFKRKKEETPEEKLDRTLTRLSERIEILEAIMLACNNYSIITSLICESDNSKDAKENLRRKYELSDIQSQAIIDMRIKALTKMERKKLFDECQECKDEYEELKRERMTLGS